MTDALNPKSLGPSRPVVLTATHRAVLIPTASAKPGWVQQRGVAQPDANTIVPTAERAVAPRIDGLMLATEREPFTSKWVKRPVVAALTFVMTLLQRRITSERQVAGGEWTQNLKIGQPLVWLATHQTSLDFVNLLPLQRVIPGNPSFKIASRVLKGGLAAKIATFLIKPFVFHLNRTKMEKGVSPEEAARLTAENAETLAGIRDGFRWGQHVVLFPEGTTMTDGRIFEVKKGFLQLSRVPQPGGGERIVKVAAIGYTLDPLACPPGKYLNFVNAGHDVLTYAPLTPRPGESAKDYAKRDATAFCSTVQKRLIAQSTVTASQLASVYVMGRIAQNDLQMDYGPLHDFIRDKAKAAAAAGYHVDESLLTAEGCAGRCRLLWQNLIREGYVRDQSEGFVIQAERMQREAINTDFEPNDPRRYKGYKQENPLRYCGNRLLQVMGHDPRMRAIIQS